MVTLVLLCTLAGSTPAVGVLQQGSLQVRTASAAQTAQPGALLTSGARLSTDETQWAEVSMLGGARLRLSAGSAVRLPRGQDELQVSAGRIWIQRDARDPAPLMVELPGVRLQLGPSSSVVLEHTGSAGTLIVVRAGHLMAEGSGARYRVAPGQALRRASGARGLPPPRAGGSAVASLVAEEARRALSDPSGLRGFLLGSARRARPGPRRGFALEDVPRAPAEVLGVDSGTAGALVEAGLRPPPFFEEEVPTKGPNLEVRVRFP